MFNYKFRQKKKIKNEICMKEKLTIAPQPVLVHFLLLTQIFTSTPCSLVFFRKGNIVYSLHAFQNRGQKLRIYFIATHIQHNVLRLEIYRPLPYEIFHLN